MAETSVRYQPIFQQGWWWRLDLSWRTDNADPHHFVGDWNGSGIPVLEGTPIQFTMPKFRRAPQNENELMSVDRIEIKLMMHDALESCLSALNVSAELRLWYADDPDGTWRPWFWGIIDLDDVNPDVMAIVEDTWMRRVEVVAYDGLQKLARTRFNEQARMDIDNRSRTLDPLLLNVYIGDTNLSDCVGRWNTDFRGNLGGLDLNDYRPITPSRNGVSKVVHVFYYLEELAKVAFDERYYETITEPLAHYGLEEDPVESPFLFRAITDPTTYPFPYIERGYEDLWFWYDMFSAEWNAEWESWGEFLAELSFNLGFVVTTRHHLDGSGRWYRALQYLRIDGANAGAPVTPTGVLLSKRGPKSRRQQRRLVVTTRTFSGGVMVYDMPWGDGPERKLTTHWRTMGFTDPNAGNDFEAQPNAPLVGTQKMNVLWQSLLIEYTSHRFQIVNQVRWGDNVLPTYLINTGMWYPANLCGFPGILPSLNGYHGLSGILAQYYAEAVHHPHTYIIEETWSRLAGDDGTTVEPENWCPYRFTTDTEHPSSTCSILAVEFDTERGHVTISKEVTP